MCWGIPAWLIFRAAWTRCWLLGWSAWILLGMRWLRDAPKPHRTTMPSSWLSTLSLPGARKDSASRLGKFFWFILWPVDLLSFFFPLVKSLGNLHFWFGKARQCHGASWLRWLFLVLLLSTPSMAYAMVDSLPRQNTLIITSPNLLTTIHSLAVPIMLLVAAGMWQCRILLGHFFQVWQRDAKRFKRSPEAKRRSGVLFFHLISTILSTQPKRRISYNFIQSSDIIAILRQLM